MHPFLSEWHVRYVAPVCMRTPRSECHTAPASPTPTVYNTMDSAHALTSSFNHALLNTSRRPWFLYRCLSIWSARAACSSSIWYNTMRVSSQTMVVTHLFGPSEKRDSLDQAGAACVWLAPTTCILTSLICPSLPDTHI